MLAPFRDLWRWPCVEATITRHWSCCDLLQQCLACLQQWAVTHLE
jgi:hypothetical protein